MTGGGEMHCDRLECEGISTDISSQRGANDSMGTTLAVHPLSGHPQIEWR